MITLSRYESTLERSLFKTLHELDVEISEPDDLALHGRTSAVFPTNMNRDADDAETMGPLNAEVMLFYKTSDDLGKSETNGAGMEAVGRIQKTWLRTPCLSFFAR